MQVKEDLVYVDRTILTHTILQQYNVFVFS